MSDNHNQVPSEPVLMIVGDRVALGPITAELSPHYQRWMNDFGMLRTLRGTAPLPVTAETATEIVRGLARQSDQAVFVIYETNSMRPVGTTMIVNIDYRNRTGLYGIEIGEPSARGIGLGTETTRLMLDYAFTALDLRNVMLTVSELNIEGCSAYERGGFKEFGRRRSSRWVAGKFCDDVYMDCLADDFVSPILRDIYDHPTSEPDVPRAR